VHRDNLRIKQPTRCIKYLKLYFVIKLYMFRASSVLFIRSYLLYTRQLLWFMQVMWPLSSRVRLEQNCNLTLLWGQLSPCISLYSILILFYHMISSPTWPVPVMFSDQNIVSLCVFPFTRSCFIPPPPLYPSFDRRNTTERFEVCTAVLLKTPFSTMWHCTLWRSSFLYSLLLLPLAALRPHILPTKRKRWPHDLPVEAKREDESISPTLTPTRR
jgi:hypothetical protein